MHCWAISLKACEWVPPPLGDTPAMATPSALRNRQAAVQYLDAARRSGDGRERARLRRRAADLILAR